LRAGGAEPPASCVHFAVSPALMAAIQLPCDDPVL